MKTKKLTALLQLDRNGNHCKQMFSATATGKSNDDAEDKCWREVKRAVVEQGASSFTVRAFSWERL